MSGSLVLRSGVGTAMLMVSRSRTTEKSVVARNFPGLHQRPQGIGGDILDIGFAAIQLRDLGFLNVDSGDGKSRLGELHASGRPTYPSPMMPTRAVRVLIFSSRIAAAVAHCWHLHEPDALSAVSC